MRTSTGCWTCRLRHKRCDETRPECQTCVSLSITCHFNTATKPEWMDGGERQKQKAEEIKMEIKGRGRKRVTLPVGEPQQLAQAGGDDIHEGDRGRVVELATQARDTSALPATSSERDTEPTLVYEKISFRRADSPLFSFYLDTLFPFHYPFYRPSHHQGGKSWVLEFLISRPVVREALLCPSLYYSTLARGSSVSAAALWEKVLQQSRDAFGMLRAALGMIACGDLDNHLPGAVRILTAVLQLMRFDVSVSSFDTWQAHLSASVALFKELLGNATVPGGAGAQYKHIMAGLSPVSLPSSSSLPVDPDDLMPSAEQAAFPFATALLLFDDVIAATVLRQPPRLLEFHPGLLAHGAFTDAEPPMSLIPILGVEDWIIVQIGQIAALDAWRHQNVRVESRSAYMAGELSHRAAAIEARIKPHLARLKDHTTACTGIPLPLLDAPTLLVRDSASISLVWAHASLLYLRIVASGWGAARVGLQTVESVSVVLAAVQNLASPALLRTMAWPFCVVGCLAPPERRDEFRSAARFLQPARLFGNVAVALEVMEGAWSGRDEVDFAAVFEREGGTVLLL